MALDKQHEVCVCSEGYHGDGIICEGDDIIALASKTILFAILARFLNARCFKSLQYCKWQGVQSGCYISNMKDC